MKRLSLLCLFGILMLIHSSCNKDENNEPGTIPGTWKITDIHIDDGISAVTVAGQTIAYPYTIRGKNLNTSTTFTENPNEYTSTGYYTSVTVIDYSGIKDTTEVLITASPGTGTWNLNGATFTEMFGGNTYVHEVLEFTQSRLELRENIDITSNNNGTIVHNTGSLYSTLEKQ
ncbi:MAG TPA: hypothetical protein VN763_08265 [Saprospiraceae bacterium]|nr:hypothetical protein [Saprospiraceae bacterium]HZV42899.1 hypothetical protein [Saprospiraceae bacterium]